MSDKQEAPATLRGNPKRKKALLILAATVAVVAVVWGGYEWLVASHYESTDNAYVQGNVIQITPQVGGTVMSIHAEDTDFVKAGHIVPFEMEMVYGSPSGQLAFLEVVAEALSP